jgi:hypothetical protein
MAKAKVRLEVPEQGVAYDVAVDTDADPMLVARGLAEKLQLGSGTYFLRLRDSFVIRDGVTLELVPDKTDPFAIMGVAPSNPI